MLAAARYLAHLFLYGASLASYWLVFILFQKTADLTVRVLLTELLAMAGARVDLELV